MELNNLRASMQFVNGIQPNFFLNSIIAGSINKPWKIVALAVGGVVFVALGAYVASLISLPTVFAITLGTIGLGYVFLKKTTVDKSLKAELIDKIVHDLTFAMGKEINGKMIVFGYHLKNDTKEGLTQKYKSNGNIDKAKVIQEIKATLLAIETYNENSKIQIELLILGGISQNSLKTLTVNFKTYKNTYNGLHSENFGQGNENLGMEETELYEQFLRDMPKKFSIIL